MAWPWKKKPDDDLPNRLELSADVSIEAAAKGKQPRVSILAYNGGIMEGVPDWGPL